MTPRGRLDPAPNEIDLEAKAEREAKLKRTIELIDAPFEAARAAEVDSSEPEPETTTEVTHAGNSVVH